MRVLANRSSEPTKFLSCESRSVLLTKERFSTAVNCRFVSQPTYKTMTWWDSPLNSDLRLAIAVKYWYSIPIGVLNQRYIMICDSYFSVKKNYNQAITYRPRCTPKRSSLQVIRYRSWKAAQVLTALHVNGRQPELFTNNFCPAIRHTSFFSLVLNYSPWSTGTAVQWVIAVDALFRAREKASSSTHWYTSKKELEWVWVTCSAVSGRSYVEIPILADDKLEFVTYSAQLRRRYKVDPLTWYDIKKMPSE